MSSTVLPPDKRQSLVRSARTSVGDELRNGTYFDDEPVEKRYLREDLDRTGDLV